MPEADHDHHEHLDHYHEEARPHEEPCPHHRHDFSIDANERVNAKWHEHPISAWNYHDATRVERRRPDLGHPEPGASY